ncbi:unnamed protein product [Brassicogethes aeneus]|uniref:RING-type domain-containing protein n=1 Tax=Brassicogethes aeneus TaxID=1431903 RepID=A0A9P0FMS0_BRAAE|nr:unnamed protein product [Brassicogethes aeneus]
MFHLMVVTFFAVARCNPMPDEWVGTSPFSHFTADEDHRYNDVFTSAFLNVSYNDARGYHTDKTEVGRYGGGPIGSMFGKIVHVTSKTDKNDHSGCTLPLMSSNGDGALPLPGEPWIALVKRGRCSFETKVEHAFHSEASGILIYNDRDSANLDRMSLSTESYRNISAVFIYRWKGEELARLVRIHEDVSVFITVAGQTVSRSASINRTSVLFVSITFIILIIISLAWLIFYYVQRFRYSHARERLSKRLNSAAKKAVCKIPTRTLKSGDKEIQGEAECCPICIEAYKSGDVIRLLPCSHDYHKVCIDPWLLEHRTCPMCKMDILKHYGFVVSVQIPYTNR